MRAIAVRLVAAPGMALLEQQLIALNADPDMFAGIAIAPFQQEATLVFIEAPPTIEKVAVEAVQNQTDFARIDDFGGVGSKLRRGALGEIGFWNSEAA